MQRLEYRLGRFVLQPHRQLLDYAGAPAPIGRRALDLLSVLAAAEGGLVTKDELVEAVWPNTFVEDNAIQAQIAAARKALGPEAERLSTVRGLGYRLAAEPGTGAGRARPEVATTPIAIMRSPAAGNRKPRTGGIAVIPVIVAVAALIAITAAVFAWSRLRSPQLDSVSLQAFDTTGQTPAARGLASNLVYEVGAALSNADVKVLGPGSGHAGALVLDGAVQQSGGDLRLTARLESAADHALLWSASFNRPASEAAAMQEQVANKLADVLHCALDASRYPGARVELETMRLYLRACDLEHEPHATDQVRELYQRIVAREPRFASAWSRLAYTSALSAFDMQPEQAQAVRREARHDAEVALRLNPNDGLAYESFADIGLGRLRYDQLFDLFSRGLTVQPGKAEILQDEGELLLRMGRVEDGLGELLRSGSLQPWSPEIQSDLIETRVDEGATDTGRALAERAIRIWPDNPQLRRTSFLIETRYGDAGSARAILAQRTPRGFAVSESDKQVFSALLDLREHPGPATARVLVQRSMDAYRAGQHDFDQTMLDLGQAGAVDEAFGLAAKHTAANFDPVNLDPEFLWQPGMLALRRDPRFVSLATRMGVAEFWRRTGRWPDFCSAPGWPYDCKAAAAKPPSLAAIANPARTGPASVK